LEWILFCLMMLANGIINYEACAGVWRSRAWKI
jgi:hypothetical protein